MRKMLVLVAGIVFLSGAIAHAQEVKGKEPVNCDQRYQYPNHPGPGRVYEGVSPMPTPLPGPSPVLQWICFFRNTDKVLSVSATVLDPKGNPAPFPQYDATFNYTYYPDQTEIKLSFQKMPATIVRKMRRLGWSLRYNVAFDKPVTKPLNGVAWSTGCYNRICMYLNSKGETFYVDLNNNSVIDRGPISGAVNPLSVACGMRADPVEACLAVDATGQTWRGEIRPRSSVPTWTVWEKIASKEQGPFAIACDNTRYCLVIGSSGETWKGPMSDSGSFVAGPVLRQ